MIVPQKTRYALRAILELAKRSVSDPGPVKTADIAEAQGIPVRFLEVILAQLRGGGIVDSRRGSQGGYMLARPAKELTMGDIIRFIQGPIRAVGCFEEGAGDDCPLRQGCVFLPMWDKARQAVADIYDRITFDYLVEQDRLIGGAHIPSYSI